MRQSTLQPHTSPNARLRANPSARAAIAPALGSPETVPSANGYDFEDVFHDGFGRAGFEDDEHNIKRFDQPVMEEVAKLDEAKRAAAAAVTALINVQSRFPAASQEEPDPVEWKEPQEAALVAERVVVKCRVAMLNKLIADPLSNVALAMPKTTVINASVQYRHLREVDNMVRPVQSVRAWRSFWPWSFSHDITNITGDSNTQQKLNDMIHYTLNRTMCDESTQDLRKISGYLVNESPTRLQLTFRSFHCPRTRTTDGSKWQHSESYNQGVIIHKTQSLNQYDGELIHVTVVVGALRINYCDQWHNPLINEFVQQAVLIAAINNINQRNASLDNTVKITLILKHRKDTHVLDLAPAINPDTCCVKHLFVNDQTGILKLNDQNIESMNLTDRADIKGPPFRWYCCPGAHRNQRLNEYELNSLHASAFRMQTHNPLSPTQLQEVASQLADSDVSEENELLAKSARISFTDYDVIVTSYALTDRNTCKTVITVVQYPPAGMHYVKQDNPLKQKQEVIIREIVVHDTNQRGPKPKRDPFKDLPPEGTMQYVIWYSKDNDDESTWPIYLIDRSQNRTRTAELMQYGKETNREIWNAFKDTGKWVSSGTRQMVENIKTNLNPGNTGETVREIYRRKWGEYINQFITDLLGQTGHFPHGHEKSYLYCKKDSAVWDDFGTTLGRDTIRRYKAFIEKEIQHDHQNKTVDVESLREQIPSSTPADFSARLLGANPAPPGTIAIPGGARQQSTTPAAVLALIQQMKERISALEEARTDESRAEGNTEHLLRQVLSTLTHSP